MRDAFGRDIYYLRISVTDRCNLRCSYCMPAAGARGATAEDVPGAGAPQAAGGVPADAPDTPRPPVALAAKGAAAGGAPTPDDLSRRDTLSAAEIADIVAAAAASGIRKVRVTGGEPLLRPDIVDVCRQIASVSGIEELCLTTNGTLLSRYALALRAAGVDRLNVSLDTLDPGRYAQVTRGGRLQDVLDGLAAARRAGFGPIKLNVVLIGGFNDSEVGRFVELTRTSATNVRFIELMPVGQCAGFSAERFIANQAVLGAVPGLVEAGGDGVSRLYRLPDGQGTVGLISPISSQFCRACNRVRVTADGQLKPCLHSASEVSLRGLHGAGLRQAIAAAIWGKPQKHHLDAQKSASLRNMNAIGG